MSADRAIPEMPKRVFQEQDLAAIYRLRVEAWSTRINASDSFQDGQWNDKYDATALHWGIKKAAVMIASARLNMSSDINALPYGSAISGYVEGLIAPFFMLSRLVVAPCARNQGYSRLFDKVRLQTVLDNGRGTAFVMTSNSIRTENLLRLGFRQVSGSGAFDTFPGGKSTLFAIPYNDIKI